ncbi:hypothetical protein N752_19905 [Desulforamulus aquiferis]|nr:hypothetical protein N752_19905 [Desulforamulus aquiferis]
MAAHQAEGNHSGNGNWGRHPFNEPEWEHDRYFARLLPLRNIPVVKPFAQEVPLNLIEFSNILKAQLSAYDSDGFKEPVAIAMKGPGGMGFKRIQEIASEIVQVTKEYLESQPLIMILEEDCGKVLGQTLRVLTGGKCGVICLDQITADDGDYIDIGVPIMDGATVPVVIKTLIFENRD